jgi:hypothetical protein
MQRRLHDASPRAAKTEAEAEAWNFGGRGFVVGGDVVVPFRGVFLHWERVFEDRGVIGYVV